MIQETIADLDGIKYEDGPRKAVNAEFIQCILFTAKNDFGLSWEEVVDDLSLAINIIYKQIIIRKKKK